MLLVPEFWGPGILFIYWKRLWRMTRKGKMKSLLTWTLPVPSFLCFCQCLGCCCFPGWGGLDPILQPTGWRQRGRILQGNYAHRERCLATSGWSLRFIYTSLTFLYFFVQLAFNSNLTDMPVSKSWKKSYLPCLLVAELYSISFESLAGTRRLFLLCTAAQPWYWYTGDQTGVNAYSLGGNSFCNESDGILSIRGKGWSVGFIVVVKRKKSKTDCIYQVSRGPDSDHFHAGWLQSRVAAFQWI